MCHVHAHMGAHHTDHHPAPNSSVRTRAHAHTAFQHGAHRMLSPHGDVAKKGRRGLLHGDVAKKGRRGLRASRLRKRYDGRGRRLGVGRGGWWIWQPVDVGTEERADQPADKSARAKTVQPMQVATQGCLLLHPPRSRPCGHVFAADGSWWYNAGGAGTAGDLKNHGQRCRRAFAGTLARKLVDEYAAVQRHLPDRALLSIRGWRDPRENPRGPNPRLTPLTMTSRARGKSVRCLFAHQMGSSQARCRRWSCLRVWLCHVSVWVPVSENVSTW